MIVQEHGKATSLDTKRLRIPTASPNFFSLHLIGKSHTIALAQRTQLLNINTKINLKSIFTKTFCSMHAFLTLTRIKAIFFGLGNSFLQSIGRLARHGLARRKAPFATVAITSGRQCDFSFDHTTGFIRVRESLEALASLPKSAEVSVLSTVSFKTRLVSFSHAHQRGHHLELQDSNAGLTRLLGPVNKQSLKKAQGPIQRLLPETGLKFLHQREIR